MSERNSFNRHTLTKLSRIRADDIDYTIDPDTGEIRRKGDLETEDLKKIEQPKTHPRYNKENTIEMLKSKIKDLKPTDKIYDYLMNPNFEELFCRILQIGNPTDKTQLIKMSRLFRGLVTAKINTVNDLKELRAMDYNLLRKLKNIGDQTINTLNALYPKILESLQEEEALS